VPKKEATAASKTDLRDKTSASSGSSSGRDRFGSSAGKQAGREMDRMHYTKKVQEADQKIQALQKRIQGSKQREKDLNAEHQKVNQGIIRHTAMGSVGEEAGSRGSRTQRIHERGKAALDGPGVAMT